MAVEKKPNITAKGSSGPKSGCQQNVQQTFFADTVGAGDTVGAILVEAIIEDGLDKLTGERLSLMLDRAARAAAITVSRSGALPPGRDEI